MRVPGKVELTEDFGYGSELNGHMRLREPPSCLAIWEFPKIRGNLFRGPYNNKDPTI